MFIWHFGTYMHVSVIICVFQPVLVPYLMSVAGGREDKGLRESLSSLLKKLSSSGILTLKVSRNILIIIFIIFSIYAYLLGCGTKKCLH